MAACYHPSSGAQPDLAVELQRGSCLAITYNVT